MKTDDLLTLKGFVHALPRSAEGTDSTKVAVVTEDGSEYRILHKSAGMDLADLISADVEVTGWAQPLPQPDEAEPEGSPATFLFTVRKYTLADGYDDPWYDDEP